MEKQIRYTCDSKDRIRQWHCWAGEKDGKPGIFYTDGLLNVEDDDDYKLKDPTFKIAKEKNVGKSNYLSPLAQSLLMVEMEVGKKERSNYFATPELARKNKLWLPMLAHKYEKYKNKLIYPVLSQPKLDGARCNIYWCTIENRVVARTRTGKLYSSVCDHLINELKPIIKANPGLIFDGELYNHALKHDFERLMSLARQQKPTKEELLSACQDLEYHIYDVYHKDKPNMIISDRISIVKQLSNISSLFMVVPCVGTIVNTEEELDSFEEKYLEEGYEGQMVRVLNSEYKVDGRSQELLKKKQFTDAEFEIVNITEGTANWKGIAKRIEIRLPDGRTQGCGLDGSYEVNRERFLNKENLIGKLATVRYFRHTKDGMLYIPVCKDIDRHDL